MPVAKKLLRRPLALLCLGVIVLMALVGIYAPFFASSKPLFVLYDGTPYFPLFRYLFFPGFFTKKLDLFFNALQFTLPVFLLAGWYRKKGIFFFAFVLQIVLFIWAGWGPQRDPAADISLHRARQEALREGRGEISWSFSLKHMNDYARLNLVLQYILEKKQQQALLPYLPAYLALEEEKGGRIAPFPTLWNLRKEARKEKAAYLLREDTPEAKEEILSLEEKEAWLKEQSGKVRLLIMPLFRPFHWEDDAGGSQTLNRVLPWWEVTRIHRKDLVAALLFGVRISLVVGVVAVFLSLMIGVPVGSLAGYYGGKFDIILSRLFEVWESMPVFFMLLLVVAITANKSIFLVIAVIGFFGWTGFSRYIRGEFFKQKNLPYVEACRAQGFSDSYTMFRHILPNAISPLITLLPFAVMGAITSEAGLSFLGLGEEGSCSWGVLMDEGRRAFPSESYLLWPPALLLTILLIAIALLGDGLRDALDPRSS